MLRRSLCSNHSTCPATLGSCSVSASLARRIYHCAVLASKLGGERVSTGLQQTSSSLPKCLSRPTSHVPMWLGRMITIDGGRAAEEGRDQPAADRDQLPSAHGILAISDKSAPPLLPACQYPAPRFGGMGRISAHVTLARRITRVTASAVLQLPLTLCMDQPLHRPWQGPCCQEHRTGRGLSGR